MATGLLVPEDIRLKLCWGVHNAVIGYVIQWMLIDKTIPVMLVGCAQLECARLSPGLSSVYSWPAARSPMLCRPVRVVL